MKTLIRALAALAVALSVPEVAHAISGPSDVQRGGTITDSTSTNVVINIEGLQSVAFNIQGSTGTYTVKAYVSPDGANWVVTEVFLPVDETTATSITADGLYIVEYTSGMKAVKVQATACTTCSVPIYMRATAGSPPLTQTLTSVAGTAASGAAASGNPVLNGGRADATFNTAVDDGDAVALFTNEYGALSVNGGTIHGVADDAKVRPVKIGAIAETGATQPTAVDDADAVNVLANEYGHLMISGGTLHGTADDAKSRPVKLGAVAEDGTAFPTAQADADVVNLLSNEYGHLMITGAQLEDAANDALNRPVKIGAIAEAEGAALSVVSADGDIAEAKTDLNGRLLVRTSHPNSFVCIETAKTTREDCGALAASGASIKRYITDVVVGCDSATPCTAVTLSEGTDTTCATANTALIGALTLDLDGGPLAMHFNTPIPTSANTFLCVASTTSAASWTVSGFLGP